MPEVPEEHSQQLFDDVATPPAPPEAGEADQQSESTDADTTSARPMRVDRPYPRRTLEQAVRVAQVIRDHNGGNAWPKDQVAEALGIKPGSSNFKYLVSAARDFGLTVSNSSDGTVELTSQGREVVYPTSDEQEVTAKLTAFNNVPIFKAVVEHYGGNNLPERRFVDNTLQKDFNLHPSVLDEFVDLFDKNCRYAGIGTELLPPQAPGFASIPAATIRVSQSYPATQPGEKPVCFVIMPFTERSDRHETGFFREVLSQVFTPALENAGFEVRTAHKKGSDIIQATIVTELLKADMVLADLTEHNPNVLFELGVRMKEERPVALVRAKGTGPIFDIDNMIRVEEYSPNLWPTTVKEDIPKIASHARATYDNHGSSKSFMQILTEQG